MTKEEMQKIRKRIRELQQQQLGLRNENGLHHQAIHEIGEAFSQVEARIDELRMLIPKGGPPDAA